MEDMTTRPHSHPQEDHTARPIRFLNPTAARRPLERTEPGQCEERAKHDGTAAKETPEGAQVEWRSRDNRKGRHVLVVPKTHDSRHMPQLSSNWRPIASNIGRMCTVFAWWDVSWWIGVLFTFGSAIFVISGCFYWVPIAYPGTVFPGESLYAGGILSFIGATLFQIGAVLLIVEAVNENQTGCFGWALEQALSKDGGSSEEKLAGHGGHSLIKHCSHHHTCGLHTQLGRQHPSASRKWEWWPSWHELRTHYWYEIGFQASFQLAVGATVFYVSGIMALPGIVNKISTEAKWGSYWLTYLIGGVLFIISSAFYMLETQRKWYTPSPHVLGWWIGVFNMIGGVGWTLSASFGYCSAHWCDYQSDLSLLWASVAFTIGSLLLWYEALDKYPVERARN